MTVLRAVSRSLLLLALAAPLAQAQVSCPPIWIPGEGLPGANSYCVVSCLWDQDGPGPGVPLVVIGGSFTAMGNVVAHYIAAYDRSTGAFQALGTGTDGGVSALGVLPNGDLLVGGYFTTAGGVAAANLARWDGSTWTAFAPGLDGGVDSIAILPGGNVVVAGAFNTAGGVAARHIALWNGANWSAMGSGFSLTGGSDYIHEVAALPNGEVVAVGQFDNAGGVAASRVARWDGIAWHPLGAGVDGTVFALAVTPSGDVLVGGWFTSSGGQMLNRIASWNGSSWSSLGTGIDDGGVGALALLPNGDVVAGGQFGRVSGVSMNNIARWTGSVWVPLGTGIDTSVKALTAMPNGEFAASGSFSSAGGLAANHVAWWTGSSWAALGSGVSDIVYAIHERPNGDLIVSGDFLGAGGNLVNRIARFDGSTWSSLGAGFAFGGVRAVATLPNGDLVAAVSFTGPSGTPASTVARWDGTQWLPLGTGFNGAVAALAVLSNGDLVAAGSFSTAGAVSASRIARWDGANWNPLGAGLRNSPTAGSAYAMVVMPNGDLVVGGEFVAAGSVGAGRLARWDGANWHAIGGGVAGSQSRVLALASTRNGQLLVGGIFSSAGAASASVPANNIVRWDGVAWNALGSGISGPVLALAELPDGDVLVGGQFIVAGGVSANRVARWDGASWSGVDNGVDGAGSPFTFPGSWVGVIEVLRDGTVAVGGRFVTAGGLVGAVVSANFARLQATCPTAVSVVGTGCSGGGGQNVLSADSLPWAGSTFATRCSGFPGNATALAMLGLSTVSFPASTAHPAGLPGCTVLTLGELHTAFLFPVGGVATFAVAVPEDPSLVGLSARVQIAGIERNAQSVLTGITTSNALDFVIGRF